MPWANWPFVARIGAKLLLLLLLHHHITCIILLYDDEEEEEEVTEQVFCGLDNGFDGDDLLGVGIDSVGKTMLYCECRLAICQINKLATGEVIHTIQKDFHSVGRGSSGGSPPSVKISNLQQEGIMSNAWTKIPTVKEYHGIKLTRDGLVATLDFGNGPSDFDRESVDEAINNRLKYGAPVCAELYEAQTDLISGQAENNTRFMLLDTQINDDYKNHLRNTLVKPRVILVEPKPKTAKFKHVAHTQDAEGENRVTQTFVSPTTIIGMDVASGLSLSLFRGVLVRSVHFGLMCDNENIASTRIYYVNPTTICVQARLNEGTDETAEATAKQRDGDAFTVDDVKRAIETCLAKLGLAIDWEKIENIPLSQFGKSTP